MTSQQENVSSEMSGGMADGKRQTQTHDNINNGAPEPGRVGIDISKLSDDQCRKLYPELIKRLDDSENKVRIAACSTLSSLVDGMPKTFDGTNVEYMIANLLVHMDDSDAEVQEAVYATACRLAVVFPMSMEKELAKIRGLHRSTYFIDRISKTIHF
jgi:HEAT repeat